MTDALAEPNGLSRAGEEDVLVFDVSDAALEAAAMASPGGGAMSFPNAPTVSVLVVCCSNDSGERN